MEKFNFYSPTRVIFGNGVRHQLGNELGKKYKKVLLAVSKGPFRENGLYDEIRQSMEKLGITVFDIPDIDSNPRLSSVREGLKVCKENSVECVVALGGGSAMDCSKVIAAAAKSDIDPYNFLWGDRVTIKDSLDSVMVPTIAATGTEVNPYAVIVNDETKEKYYCEVPFPKIAIMDPEITATLPLKLTVWGAMDILSHTFEFYFNGYNKSEFQTRFSEAIIHATMKTVEDLVKDTGDLNARGELMWCAVMAWGGLTKVGRGDPDMGVHSIEESFSGYFDTHHGGGCGVLTPRWMKLVNSHAPEVFARFARNILNVDSSSDKTAALKGIKLYKDWLKKVGAPNTFFDLGDREFKDEELEHVAKTAWKIYGGKIGKLKELTLDEVITILKKGKIRY